MNILDVNTDFSRITINQMLELIKRGGYPFDKNEVEESIEKEWIHYVGTNGTYGVNYALGSWDDLMGVYLIHNVLVEYDYTIGHVQAVLYGTPITVPSSDNDDIMSEMFDQMKNTVVR